MMSRIARRFLTAFACSSIVFGVTTLQRPAVFSAAPQVRLKAPGYYRVVLGAFEVTVLSDGTHPFPDARVLTKPRSGNRFRQEKLFQADRAEASRLLASADLRGSHRRVD